MENMKYETGFTDADNITEKISKYALENPLPEKLLEEWDYEKNIMDPKILSAGSHKKVWWICPKGHSYNTAIEKRVRNNTGCPYCSNKKIMPGFNDLATTRPNIAKEWDYSKNDKLTPKDVSAGSGKKVWWICPKGHSYDSIIIMRTSYNVGCPYCNESKIEKTISNFLMQYNISFETQSTFKECKYINKLRFDFKITDNRFTSFLIEGQGEQHKYPVDFAGKGEEWAKEQLKIVKKRDKIKVDFCKKTGNILEEIWYNENVEEKLIELLRKHIKPEYNLDTILKTNLIG